MLFKLSLDMEGQKRISGNDLFTLLEYIRLYGSISRAAAKAGVSYRYAWGLLQEAEKTLKLTLVDKQAGGYAGGGALLTLDGKEMLREYRDFKGRVDRELADFLGRTGNLQHITADAHAGEEMHQAKAYLLLASTMEPVETGLLDALETEFYREKGIFVRHLAAGSGKALEIARGGRVDMALTHAPELEAEFMAEGWGAYQYPVMTDDFALVGPTSDPAGIGRLKKMGGIIEVFQRIAQEKAPFVTRGDHSGTHLREVEIWEKANTTPMGDWYNFYPGVAGNLGALRFARGKKAYMLTDSASYHLSHGEGDYMIFLDSSMTDGEELKNTFVLTLVNPEKVPASRLQDALIFARWLQKEGGKKIVSEFGQSEYRSPLFTPFTPK